MSKKDDTEKVFVLKADGSNLIRWLEAIENQCQKDHGEVCEFITTGYLIVRPVPDKTTECTKFQIDPSTAAGARMHENAISLYQKKLERESTAHISIFGMIKQNLSEKRGWSE